MSNNSNSRQTGIAVGAISAFAFVERDVAIGTDNQVKNATANGRTIGIGPNYATATGAAVDYAYSGLEWLQIGSGGCTIGDRLKSDATGFGVTVQNGGTVPQNVGALATKTANSGDRILCQIENYTEQPGDYLS